MNVITPVGQCRYCRCTAANPCKLSTGDECGWVTAAQDLCTKPGCMIAEEKRLKRERYARKNARRGQWQPPFRVLKRDAKGRATHYVKNTKKKERPA